MRTQRTGGVRPRVEGLESRCLLSVAVVEVQNKSTYNVTFDFRWSPSSAWTSYTEAPGQGEIYWNNYSN